MPLCSQICVMLGWEVRVCISAVAMLVWMGAGGIVYTQGGTAGCCGCMGWCASGSGVPPCRAAQDAGTRPGPVQEVCRPLAPPLYARPSRGGAHHPAHHGLGFMLHGHPGSRLAAGGAGSRRLRARGKVAATRGLFVYAPATNQSTQQPRESSAASSHGPRSPAALPGALVHLCGILCPETGLKRLSAHPSRDPSH
ncbi:MAG: hypothetical protein J3K34DRAFT_284359 [Monoraphidium minutum]|nr:MAG: hypothetical protein J3K34DRAFT_284359 [Monoraphidium minutum]